MTSTVIDLPPDLLSEVRQRASASGRDLEPTILELIRLGLQTAELLEKQRAVLADLTARRFTPPPGTPESVEWLREDRDR